MRFLAFLLTLQVAIASSNVRALWDTQNGPVYTAGVVGAISASEFSAEALRRLAARSIRIGTFVAYPTQEDWLRGKGYGGTDCMYENWRAELERRRLTIRPLRCPEVSQAIKIGTVIVVRRINANCEIVREIVQGGADPLQLDLSGSRYSVLDVVIQPLTKEQVAAKDMFSPIHIFARTDGQITPERAGELLQYIKTLSHADDMTVILRNDQWFVTECDFPVLFLFDGVPSAMPSKEEALNARKAVCVALKQWPVRCY